MPTTRPENISTTLAPGACVEFNAKQAPVKSSLSNTEFCPSVPNTPRGGAGESWCAFLLDRFWENAILHSMRSGTVVGASEGQPQISFYTGMKRDHGRRAVDKFCCGNSR
jgi:hypothetical protein